MLTAVVVAAACTPGHSADTATTAVPPTSATGPTITAPPTTTSPTTTTPFLFGRYNAIAMTIGDDVEPLRYAVFIDFGATFNAHVSCNDIEEARWTITDGHLELGHDVQRTFIGCDTDQDQRIIDLLDATPTVVFGAGGTIILGNRFGPAPADSVTLTLSPTATAVALDGAWAATDGLPIRLRFSGDQRWIDGCRTWLTESTFTRHTLVITAIEQYPGPVCDDVASSTATATAFIQLVGRFDITLTADTLTLRPATGPQLIFHRA